MDAAFRAGQAHYIHQQGPAPQQLEADGVGYVLAALGPMVGPCAFSSLAAMPSWLVSEEGKAFCRAYARTRKYISTALAEDIALTQKPLFPQIEEIVLKDCIQSYQQMGCWPEDIEISRSGFEAMLDIFAFDNKISKRPAYQAICMKAP